LYGDERRRATTDGHRVTSAERGGFPDSAGANGIPRHGAAASVSDPEQARAPSLDGVAGKIEAQADTLVGCRQRAAVRPIADRVAGRALAYAEVPLSLAARDPATPCPARGA
jgi:hypothetical protein